MVRDVPDKTVRGSRYTPQEVRVRCEDSLLRATWTRAYLNEVVCIMPHEAGHSSACGGQNVRVRQEETHLGSTWRGTCLSSVVRLMPNQA